MCCVCSVAWIMSDSLQPMHYSSPGSSVHGILQARILEWVAVPSSREFSWLGNRILISCDSCIAGRFFTHGATWHAHLYTYLIMEHLSTWHILTHSRGPQSGPVLCRSCPGHPLLCPSPCSGQSAGSREHDDPEPSNHQPQTWSPDFPLH